ncbi:MFS transporter [Candidatus Woesebacteria bacterium]|nr:MFS transporter [Candidatus Woesebacteria bacterium]
MPRYREHHLQLPNIHIQADSNDNLKFLYGVRVSRDLVNKLALFFMPVFLFEFGRTSGLYSFTGHTAMVQGMIALGVYYILYALIALTSAIPLAQLVRKIGHQKTMVFSYLVRLVALLLLFLTTTNPYLIFLAVFFEAIQSNMFWPSYHTVLSKNTLKNHMGQDLGILQFLLQLVAAISPAISGLIAVLVGIEFIFLVAIVGTLIGLIFTLFLDIKIDRDSVSLKEFLSWLKERRFRKLTLTISGRYINDAVLYIWPLYVYIFLGSVDKVGYLYTISLFIAMMFTFFIGVYIDHSKSKKPYFFSGGVLTVLWLVRTQFLSVVSIALIDVVDRLTSNFHWLFYDMLLMRRSKGRDALSYFVYREIILNLTAIFFWSVFMLFFIFDFGWNSLFIFASVGVMLTLMIREKEQLDE